MPISKWIRTPYSRSWNASCCFVGKAIMEPSRGERRYLGVGRGTEEELVVEVILLAEARVVALRRWRSDCFILFVSEGLDSTQMSGSEVLATVKYILHHISYPGRSRHVEFED